MTGRKIIFGFALVALGLLLLSNTLDLFYFSFEDFMSFIFPLALIALGVWLLTRDRRQRHPCGDDREIKVEVKVEDEDSSGQPGQQPGESFSGSPGGTDRMAEQAETGASGKAKYSKFIGDMFIDCDGRDLQDVEISNFLGDVEVKLHGGKLAPGLNRMVISGFIGDVRVLVPQGMPVFAQSSNFVGDLEIMGRRSAGFGNNLDGQTNNYTDAESKLYVATNHFIGDVRVYVV